MLYYRSKGWRMGKRLLAIVLAVCLSIGQGTLAATPPGQPETGPGGKGDPGTVAKRMLGTHNAVTYIFYSAEMAGKTKPVAVIFHPWGGTDPQLYGGWIDHLARQGYLVLFPQYQVPGKTPGKDASERATHLVKSALDSLRDDPDVQPDLNRIAYIGHLAGSIVALNLAAQQSDLPTPRLVLAVMPGGIASAKEINAIPLSDLATMAPETMLITMSNDRNSGATDRVARRLLQESRGVSLQNKLFIRVNSDAHGFPALSASLTAPGSPLADYSVATIGAPPDPTPVAEPAPTPRGKNKGRGRRAQQNRGVNISATISGEQLLLVKQIQTNVTDTLDYLAFWKTFDMATEAAFSGREAVSLRENPTFIDMGVWSDGFPVKRLGVEMLRPTDDEIPAAIAR